MSARKKTPALPALSDAEIASIGSGAGFERMKSAIEAGAVSIVDLWEGKVKVCPSCGGSMELVKASEGGMIEEPYFSTHPLRGAELPRRKRPATFWACSSCEHCEER